MKRYFHSSVTALAMTAMVMSGVVPAFSQGKGSGQANSNRGGNDVSRNARENNRGGTASSLGALNAAHANANAFANAAENSRVGMIELYKVAVMASADAKAAFVWFKDSCETPVDEAVDQCAAILLAASEDAGKTLDYISYLEILGDKVEALGDLENDALELAANNKTDDDVIEALWDLLEPEDPEAIE